MDGSEAVALVEGKVFDSVVEGVRLVEEKVLDW